MLVISRVDGEGIVIPLDDGRRIRIVLIRNRRRQALIGIDAPREIPIWREELLPLVEAKGVQP